MSSDPAHQAFSQPPSRSRRIENDSLAVELNANGSVHRMDAHGVMLNLFLGNEVEGGPANIYLRRHRDDGLDAVALLGPRSPTTATAGDDMHERHGRWGDLQLQWRLVLAATGASWFWHVRVGNLADRAQTIDLIHVQDVGLSPYGATRLNEHYVSHYVDLTSLHGAACGIVVAARQNLAVGGRHPWAVIGSLRRAVSYATDALQVHAFALRTGDLPEGIARGLPGRRRQHEHALIAVQDTPLELAPGEWAELGFFGHMLADHADATGESDLAHVRAALALPEARPPRFAAVAEPAPAARTLFSEAPLLEAMPLGMHELDTLFGARRHEEHEGGELLSFFCGEDRHVVLRAKELRVQRPHGHILRSGAHLTPDETALTSTAWMAGVFHSMVTQGHVSINRFLSTVHSWLGLFRAHGQRVFVHDALGWHLLGVPSAFEMSPHGCRWIYRHRGGLLELCAQARRDAPALSLELRVLEGAPLRLLVSHHVALGGDDGSRPGPPPLRVTAEGVFVGIPAGSELASRFPAGGFVIEPALGTRFEQVGGDELLFADGRSRSQPFVCIATSAVASFGLRLHGRLVDAPPVAAGTLVAPRVRAPGRSAAARETSRLDDIIPWYRHNALVHYLSPRGLEQYSGGGWGTRDICQGPLEMLLALDRTAPVRDLLRRLFCAQNPDGDWPQWFSFFERERTIRASDSHGDIVFWPLLALARYLLATEDAAFLDELLPFHAADAARAEHAPLWQHVQRAMAVIGARRIAGTELAAYGHGDWNDSLQPADPALREHLCSAWTVTLHHQVLRTLARALRAVHRADVADTLEAQAGAVRADFQRLLVRDGVVTGYALFDGKAAPTFLLHPADTLTGVHYSLLPMMHAILEDMLSPEQAQAQLALIRAHLTGPDGARLFDRPLPYRGGPQRLFQRAESSAFFGREIGVMYTHAHLRYAEALAHLGDADGLLDALAKAHPLSLRERVPSADLRQANCYFSSSDAAFADRYEASREYERVAQGSVALDGGWRIYSSGPGIALGVLVGRFLGIRQEASTLVVDPVVPPALDGLYASLSIGGRLVHVDYEVRARGHGVTRIALNGHTLPFTRGTNPYRVGAAEVPMQAFIAARAAQADDRLAIRVG